MSAIATLEPDTAALGGEAAALYPFTSRFFPTRDGLRMHYVDEGVGEPVVMVHGNPTWSFHFRELIGDLRGSRRCIALDHIGCGLSDKPDDGRYEHTLERRIDDLEALLEHLGIDRDVTLVVHDWGGMIGMGWAARHPERVARIVVMNTAAFRLPSSKGFPWQLWLARTPIGGLMVRGLGAFSQAAVRVCVTRRPLPKAVRDGYLAPYAGWGRRRAVLRFVEDIPLSPGDRAWDTVVWTEERLEKLRGVPMLICWGERDFVFDVKFLDEWIARFPDADVHRWADSGHFVLEDRTEEILDLVRSFLADHPIDRPMGRS